MTIWCMNCEDNIQGRLTDCKEVFPHRPDLVDVPMWICDQCDGYVGCHKDDPDLTPLGYIPTNELRAARRYIHALIDPMWQSGKIDRKELYKHLSEKLGRQYHTAKLKNVEEARQVYRWALDLDKTLS